MARRGSEGKILAIKYARENDIPYFGICFGMQLAAIEAVRNLLNINEASSSEFDDSSSSVVGLDKVVYEQRSDGLIIATPTGSTAYALSAGGPIIHPSLDVWTILPMLPQSISSRPFVISSKEKVAIKLLKGPLENAKICADGHDDIAVPFDEDVAITKMNNTLRLVHPIDNDFFEACREKLGWSLDISKNNN